ncbi:MAG: hypothetical protein GEU80_00635 [Dehalococcoidia bacterium]|nr:hypothetical protein [Dehalococcoidia bacterium]
MTTPSAPLARPKLRPPRRRSDTLRRNRLHRALSEAFEYDVVVISAPAGYGKSTLAVDWLDDLGLPFAWLSLDRLDRDPHTLVADLADAVRLALPGHLDAFAERLERAAGARDAAALTMELAASIQAEVDDLFVLVIDDLDAIDGAEESLAVLDQLARDAPESMRLYLLSRAWAPLPALPRMVAQRRAFTLTARDLHFEEAEALAFLAQSGVRDSASQGTLVRRADGWAAALAILVDQYDANRPEAGVDAAAGFILADFIDQEVLARLPDPAIEVLRACAVLQSFDIALARDLSGQPEAALILRDLERTNHLVVRLDDGEWFRIHAILREHLLGRLQREAPERLLTLRRSAAALYVRRGMRRDAIQMALDAEDWTEAIRELHELRDELYQRGEWATLAAWLDRLPGEVLEAEPDLQMTRARQSIKVLDGQAGLVRLEAIDQSRLTVEQRARRELYRSVALRQVGRLPDAVEACRRARSIALEELPDETPLFVEIDLEEAVSLGVAGQFVQARQRFERAAEGFERIGDHHRAAEARDGLGITVLSQGWLAEAMVELTSAQRLWRMLDDPHAQIATMNNIGNVQHMLGELETARDTFNAVVQRARDLRHPRFEAYGHEGLASLERDWRHLDSAVSLFTLAIHEAQQVDDPTLVASATYGLAMTYRERDEYARARTLLDHGLRTAEQSGALLRQARFRSGIGATLLSQRRFKEAVPFLEEATAQAAEAGAKREEAIAHLLLAGGVYALRGRARAATELERVHALVEELGYDQFLYAELRQMVEVVAYGASRRIGGDYYQGLLERLQTPAASPEPAPAAEAPTETRIRAEAFGAPRVTLAGRQISDLEWRSGRSKEMFFLLLHHRKPLRKEQIVLELWPDLPPSQVNSTFHSTLYRLRRAIDKQVVLQTPEGYRLNDDYQIAYDAAEFEQHADQADRATAGSDDWATHLSAAVDLYRGPFADSFDSEWAEAPRERYENRYLSAVLVLATHALQRGDYQEAVTLTESVLSLDPLNEEAARCLMQAHARAGFLDRAARAYRRLHQAMREELGTEPSQPVQEVYQQVLSGAALDT